MPSKGGIEIFMYMTPCLVLVIIEIQYLPSLYISMVINDKPGMSCQTVRHNRRTGAKEHLIRIGVYLLIHIGMAEGVGFAYKYLH